MLSRRYCDQLLCSLLDGKLHDRQRLSIFCCAGSADTTWSTIFVGRPWSLLHQHPLLLPSRAVVTVVERDPLLCFSSLLLLSFFFLFALLHHGNGHATVA